MKGSTSFAVLVIVAAVARTVSAGATVSVINNCGDDTEVYSTVGTNQDIKEVPSHCVGEDSACDDYEGQNPAFFVAPKGKPKSSWCGQTRAELGLNVGGSGYWENISKVKGFNYPLAIYAGDFKHVPVCMDVNCRDAYWLCDTAADNYFSPVYMIPEEKADFKIVFCPDEEESSEPLFPPAEGFANPEREQDDTSHEQYWCECSCEEYGLFSDEEIDVFVVADSECGDI